MPSILAENEQYLDLSGAPLVNGRIFIGVQNQDPVVNPQTIYSDRDLTVSIDNPQTLDAYGRSTNKIWVASEYSVRIDDSTGTQIYQNLDAGGEWDSDNISFLQSGAGAVSRTTQSKLRESVSVTDFGAVGDGVTDDTAALTAAGDALTSGDTLDFGDGTYLISASGTPSSVFGHRVLDLSSLNNITLKGNGATIKCTDHNIATNGGLTFLWGDSLHHLTVDGLNFDMSFINAHTSSTQYPHCGGIRGAHASGTLTQSQLNVNWKIRNCKFKMYHPWGTYALSGSSYLGDPNNGFKIFSIFCQGPFDGATYASQARGLTVENCVLQDGHNGYGFWLWAVNDVKIIGNTAESFVSKGSNSVGTYANDGLPMIRYHQFRCSGLVVSNNYFRAKPCSERTTAGFEGWAGFLWYGTSLEGDFSHGNCTVEGNVIIGGRGDVANTATDIYMSLSAQGSITVANNIFDDTTETTNRTSSLGIMWNSEAEAGDGGKSTLSIIGNTFSANCDSLQNIWIANGGATDADRKLKQLVVTGNASLGQLQFFVEMNATSTFFGVQDIIITDNTISGEWNTTWDKDSTNSKAIEISGSETTDVAVITRNIVRDKYYFIESNNHAGRFIDEENVVTGITTRYLGNGPTKQTLTGAGAVDLINKITHVVTTGADALTLPNGYDGQVKYIVMKTDGGAGTLTPTSLGNGSTITFDDVGDSAILKFTNGSWHFMGGTATLA